tara:strand:+ start:693 stop:821 length:129 start_codon:yes stop_codon:yes gene_type:complete
MYNLTGLSPAAEVVEPVGCMGIAVEVVVAVFDCSWFCLFVGD